MPVGRVGDVINGFVIHSGGRGQDLRGDGRLRQEANPGKLTYGSSGNGTSTHLRLEMLKFKTGVDILHVPYRGGADTLNDVLPGHSADDERARHHCRTSRQAS